MVGVVCVIRDGAGVVGWGLYDIGYIYLGHIGHMYVICNMYILLYTVVLIQHSQYSLATERGLLCGVRC